jgi:hypothetical protein
MKINKLLITIIAAAFILMGCSNSLDSTPSATGRYSVTGKISFAESSGAAPLILTKDSEGRTATTSFNNAHFSLNLYAYKYGQNGLDRSKKYDNVVVDQSGSFIFCFESKGEYVIYAELIKDEKTCGKGSAYVDVNSFTPKSVRINASPVITENGKIQLAVSAATDTDPQIKKVCVSWIRSFGGRAEDDVGGNNESSDLEAAMERRNAVESGEYNMSFDLVNGTTEITYTDFPGGNWLAKISFEDEIGNTVYSCQEIINVYPGFTTSIWYGTSPALNNGTFKVTKSMVTNYDPVIIPDTNYVLYNTTSGNYQYYLKDTPSASVSGTEDMSASSSSFCFDADGTLYSLTENIDGDIVKTSNNKTFTLSESYLTGILVDLKTNIFYTYKANQGTLNFTKYPNLISGGDTETSESYDSVYVPGNDVVYETGGDENGKARMAIYNGIVYIIARMDQGFGDYVFGWYNLTSATNGTFDLSYNSEAETLLSTGKITDILYQDGSVYMLLDGTKDEFFMDFKYSSRGAVLCYNCQTEEVTVCGWIDDATDISGKVFYAINGADNNAFLKDNINGMTELSEDEIAAYKSNKANWITIDDTIPSGSGVYPSLYFPSEAQANSAFYGPKKFIAIKPKKLVIADEGCFFYTDSNDAFCFKNVNRVVTVDLESFAISAVDDVSVTFGEDESSDMVSSGYTSVDNLNLSNCIYSTSGSDYNSSSRESVKLSIPLGE